MKNLKWIVMLVVVLTACKKPFNSASMQIKMTDAPGDFQNVYVDIQKVMVHYEGRPDDKWMEIHSNPGIYDLLTLRNNVTTVIANDNKLPLGTLTQIRLILGSNNSVVVEGVKYVMQVPSSGESGLKINVHEAVRHNDNLVVTLDFDAGSSVTTTGKGNYILNPVIKVKSIENN